MLFGLQAHRSLEEPWNVANLLRFSAERQAVVDGQHCMITYFKIAAAMIGLMLGVSLGFQLYLEYAGVRARAASAPGLAFIGISHFGRVTYAGVSWYQDFQNPGPCPLVIHLPDGDLRG